MLLGRRVQAVREGRDRQGGDRQQHQHGDRTSALGVEPLRAVLEAADEEGQAEDEQEVGKDRADQRGLDDVDQASA